jgi:hypothetical protein
VFPFEFGGKTCAGVLAGDPLGVGGGLEEAEVTDGGFGEVVGIGIGIGIGIEGLPAAEGEDAPAGAGFGRGLPVKRGAPALLAEGGPAFGEPELGTVVGVVVHEGEVFGAGDEAGGEGEWGEIDGVTGGFVVEGEVIPQVFGMWGNRRSFDSLRSLRMTVF